MKDKKLGHTGHPPVPLVAAYAIGKCSPAEQSEIEEHCLSCEECRTRLTILLHVCTAESEEEQRRLDELFPSDMEAIAQARQRVSAPGVETALNGTRSAPKLSQLNSSRHWRISDLLANRAGRRSYPPLILAAVSLVVLGAIYFWAQWRRSPVQDGLTALRLIHRQSRPLEARVTGGFDYQPYERKRGVRDDSGVDRDRLNYALAELTRAVVSHPTPEARHNLGRFYLLLGEFDRAEEQLTQALAGAPREAGLNADLAALYYELSSRADPLPLLSKAAEHYDTAIEVEPQLGEAWFNRALCHEQMGLLSKAQADWERYLQLDSDSPWAAEARERLKGMQVRAAQSADQDKQAQAEFRAAATAGDEKAMRRLMTERFIAVKQLTTEQIFDEYLTATIAGETSLADAHLKTLTRAGQLAAEIKGDRFIADAVDLAARGSPAIKQELREVRSALRQADQELARGSLDAAFNLYSSARRAAERIGDQCHAEIAAFNLARYYNSRANFQGLSIVSRQLIASTESHRHRHLQSQALLALANAYFGSLQISRALEFSLQAARIAKELGDVETVINSLRYAGVAYARMGDYERALGKNFEAVSLLRDYSVTPLRASQAYANMGETLLRMGSYPKALDYQLEALRAAERSNNPMVLAGLVGRLGLNYWKLGRNEDATRYLNDAITRAEAIKDQMARLQSLVDTYTTLGDFFLQQNKVDRAIAAYQQAIRTIGETNNRTYLSAIHQGLAAAYLAQGKVAEAEAELQTSIKLAERDRRQINDARGRSVFLASRQNVYYAMMDFQLSTRRDSAQAYNYAEISKSRDLLDTLTGLDGLKRSDGHMTLALRGSARPLTLKQVQRALPAGAQLVEYVVAQDRLVIWLVTRDEIFPASADVSADRLRRLVTDYLAGLRARRDVGTLNRQATELYQMLISPIVSRLNRNRTLCIVPDGILSQLPFAALVSPKTGAYLVEDFSLTINPSASVLAQALQLTRAKRPSVAEAFLGLSNPRFNQQRFPNLPALPSAEEEVDQVKSGYSQAQLLNREHATESALAREMGDYEIVHLATHVVIDEQSPLLSSIVLAEENRQTPRDRARGLSPWLTLDGKLQAHEIYQLKLARTRLVILSGCRSALGSHTRGEALSGLAQAFFAARVPAVIASLWDVDDESTAEMMQSFHFYHRVKQQGFSEALRQAQRSMIHAADTKQRHPYYWAAFLLAGDGLPIVPQN